ncbi:MAG TPA: hypothetical protein VEK15_04265 [Vicinamibacteria bacterium]|nr:hypothetical protein [Vicinamibacteria bacterium]
MAGRALLIVGGIIAFGLSRLVEPLYRARPQILLSEPAFLLPPRGLRIVILLVLGFVAIWMVESFLFQRVTRRGFRVSCGETLTTYDPFVLLLPFAILLLPGRGVFPQVLWWLVLDAHRFLVTLVVASVILLKVNRFAPLDPLGRALLRQGSRLVIPGFAAMLMLALFAWTPERRFSQPYDDRWGTGDEPRYIRLTASLLHDGDTDIGNAEDLIGKRLEPGRAGARIARWIPAAITTSIDAWKSLLGIEPAASARWIGGPVLEGRKGGTFYVFLPGLPLLLTPSMAIDAYFHPDRLVVTLFTCLLFGTACTLLIARLVEPTIGTRRGALALGLAVGITPPLFFYHFQVYTEIVATICITLMLTAVLAKRLTLGSAVAFGLAGALLPWLHTKYLPIWGALLVGCCWKGFRSAPRWRVLGTALVPACLGLGLQCLYVFQITGSLLPDALWVARGYPRGETLFNAETLSGLYHLLLGRSEGVLIYAPLYLFTLPGLIALRRESPFAFGLSLAIALPYLLAAASHDRGGAGAWAPPGRYIVPLVPVMAVGIAAWLRHPITSSLRWFSLLIGTAAGFWTGQSMLTERNFVYDRAAFLAAGVVDPSPALGSVDAPQPLVVRCAFPTFLALCLGGIWLWERKGWRANPTTITAAMVIMLIVMGSLAASRSEPEDWIPPRRSTGAIRLRGARPLYLVLPECGSGFPRLKVEGTGGSHAATVSGPGFERELHVPASRSVELGVSLEPIRALGSEGRREFSVLKVALREGQNPIDVEVVCR